MRYWKSPYWLLLMAATSLLSGINLYYTVTQQNDLSNDFARYAKFIDPMKTGWTITTPHFIYPMLVAIASAIFPNLSYATLGGFIVLVFQLLLAHILWSFWKSVLPKGQSGFIPIALTLVTMTLAPINLLTLFKHNSYFGYIGITVYHNPPIAICRPVAFLNFIFFAAGIADRKISNRQISLCIITIVLATLMKPNYAIIMVPAAAIFAGIAYYRGDFQLLRFISLGTLLPGCLILAGQFLFTYISPDPEMGRSQIFFAPFLVYGRVSQFLFPKFILSVLFPLSVLMVFWKSAIKDRYYMIGLLLFLIGAAQAYFLAEHGTRLFYGNFLWSAQLGLFFWFIASMRFVILRVVSDSARRSPKLIAIYLIFSLHVVSGVVWYIHETISPGGFW